MASRFPEGAKKRLDAYDFDLATRGIKQALGSGVPVERLKAVAERQQDPEMKQHMLEEIEAFTFPGGPRAYREFKARAARQQHNS